MTGPMTRIRGGTAGMTLAGSVRHVFSRGKRVVTNGELTAAAGHGRFIGRGATVASF